MSSTPATAPPAKPPIRPPLFGVILPPVGVIAIFMVWSYWPERVNDAVTHLGHTVECGGWTESECTRRLDERRRWAPAGSGEVVPPSDGVPPATPDPRGTGSGASEEEVLRNALDEMESEVARAELQFETCNQSLSNCANQSSGLADRVEAQLTQMTEIASRLDRAESSSRQVGRENTQLRAEIDTLRTQIGSAGEELESARRDAERVDQQAESLRAEIRGLTERLREAIRQGAWAEAELTEDRWARQERCSALSSRARRQAVERGLCE